ncbi:MAG TPA: transglycosylase SLT domain-containing protein [Terriglobia bacterium]|nr:transglycosylase SLT domain-containing protein [Terriglobia bacterium]
MPAAPAIQQPVTAGISTGAQEPASSPSQAPAAAQAADPAAALLAKAQATYQSGVEDYRSGLLEKAREEFDRALSMLLQSDLDLETHDRLNSEFDDLVENIYDMELAAVERGDTLNAHTYEPPPIESFAGLTFPVDPNVKERAAAELESVHSDLPLVSNDYVDGVLTYLQSHGRHYIETVLKRRGTYGAMISEVLRKEGLPQDLIYVAAGESSFNPHALSRKGAKGIWQFMPGTGELYGLKENRWVDEREDPVKSTEAAARVLKDLYKTFGDWFLAMAAYDWSPAGVQKAIQRTGYADYWKLRQLGALPAETQNYVPIFLATALIAKDPKTYGFDVVPDPSLQPDSVVVSVPTDLRLVAQLIDHPVEELVRLNPSLLRWTTPASDPSFVLNLPPGTKDVFERTIAHVPPDRRIWWRAYEVQDGDTLASVARRFRISPVSLARANQMDGHTLETGSQLLLPLSPGPESSLARVRERTRLRKHYYRVQRGDSLELVADRFDATTYDIRRWNHLKGFRLSPGKNLLVYVPAPARRSRRTRRKPARRHPARKSPAARARRAAKLRPPVGGPGTPVER